VKDALSEQLAIIYSNATIRVWHMVRAVIVPVRVDGRWTITCHTWGAHTSRILFDLAHVRTNGELSQREIRLVEAIGERQAVEVHGNQKASHMPPLEYTGGAQLKLCGIAEIPSGLMAMIVSHEVGGRKNADPTLIPQMCVLLDDNQNLRATLDLVQLVLAQNRDVPSVLATMSAQRPQLVG
jgi:hypothetical protein